MNELNYIQILVQSGGVGIALYLIWTHDRERTRGEKERQEERTLWYTTVNNHMSHDMALHEKQIQTLQKLCDLLKGMAKSLKKI